MALFLLASSPHDSCFFLSDNKPSHQQPLAVFRESTSFVKYVLVCVQAKIHQVSSSISLHCTGVCVCVCVCSLVTVMVMEEAGCANGLIVIVSLGGTRKASKSVAQ